jgi:hypothetical protein
VKSLSNEPIARIVWNDQESTALSEYEETFCDCLDASDLIPTGVWIDLCELLEGSPPSWKGIVEPAGIPLKISCPPSTKRDGIKFERGDRDYCLWLTDKPRIRGIIRKK